MVKRKDLLELWEQIDQYEQIRGIKFAYFLIKNKKKIQSEVETLKEIIRVTKEFEEYDKTRSELARSYADTDRNGEPIIINTNYKITHRLNEFSEKLKILQEQYRSTIEDRNKQLKEYKKLLDEEINFDNTLKIKLSELPYEVDGKFIEILINVGLLDETEE